MKILKNIVIELNPTKIQIGYSNEEADFDTKIIEIENVDFIKLNNLIDIVKIRLENDRELKKVICQITPDQHMSEERILYFDDGDFVNFIKIQEMNNEDVSAYNEVKEIFQELI